MLIVTVVLCVVLCVLWARLCRRSGPLPPLYPGALPIIGHAHIIALWKENEVFDRMKEIVTSSLKHEGGARVHIGPHIFYIVCDPEDCLTVSNACLYKPYIYKFGSPWLSDGLVTVDPPSWNVSRKLFNPLFNQRILNEYMVTFNQQGRILVDNLAAEVGPCKFNHESYLMAHVLRTACQTSLGVIHNESVGKMYSDTVEKIFGTYLRRTFRPWLHIPFIYMWSSLKTICDEYIKTAIGITESAIARKIMEQKEIEEAENDSRTINGQKKILLDMLVDKGITGNELRDHLDTMMIAAYDSTATSLIYILTLIGSYPNVQECIYNELKDVCGDSDREVDASDLSKLIYMEAAIKESLRLYPPVPIIARDANQEVKLKNYTIPAGGTYFMFLYGLNRHAIWGKDAEQFRPERWLEPGGVPDNPNAFGTFSLGKRNCLGKVYAMMSMKTTLVHFLRRYRVTADHAEMVLKWDSFLKPMSGHEIALEFI